MIKLAPTMLTVKTWTADADDVCVYWVRQGRTADADDARRRCVEWGSDNPRVYCVEREYLGQLCRFTCVIRLVPTMLTAATADADDARMPLVEYMKDLDG